MTDDRYAARVEAYNNILNTYALWTSRTLYNILRCNLENYLQSNYYYYHIRICVYNNIYVCVYIHYAVPRRMTAPCVVYVCVPV